MLTTEAANEFARLWVEAWNAHDRESILAHYSEDIVFSSPFVKKIGVDPSGSLSGRDALRAYFEAGLAKFPSLHFHLRFVLVGIDTVTLVYDSVNGLLSAFRGVKFLGVARSYNQKPIETSFRCIQIT